MIDFCDFKPSDEKLIHYSRELFKVIDFLNKEGINFDIRQMFNGWQLIVRNKKVLTEWDFDIICHDGSYGNKKGLLEVMGIIAESEYDDVEGYLTGEQVVEKIERLYLHRKKS